MSEINKNNTDIAVSIGKSVLGTAPIVGPLVSEVISNLIPNQRIDRIAKFVEKLDSKVSELQQGKISSHFQNPKFIDLLEDGFTQASRALSEERINYLASLIKNSLSEDEINYIEAKRLIGILGELNDIEIIILRSHLHHHEDDPEFFKRHESVLTPPSAYLGSSESEVDKYTIFKSHRQNLVRLELLRPRFKKIKKGSLPVFDEKTGMMKANGHSISRLGRILLKYIDQTEPLTSQKI